jgi:hypothetical protein
MKKTPTFLVKYWKTILIILYFSIGLSLLINYQDDLLKEKDFLGTNHYLEKMQTEVIKLNVSLTVLKGGLALVDSFETEADLLLVSGKVEPLDFLKPVAEMVDFGWKYSFLALLSIEIQRALFLIGLWSMSMVGLGVFYLFLGLHLIEHFFNKELKEKHKNVINFTKKKLLLVFYIILITLIVVPLNVSLNKLSHIAFEDSVKNSQEKIEEIKENFPVFSKIESFKELKKEIYLIPKAVESLSLEGPKLFVPIIVAYLLKTLLMPLIALFVIFRGTWFIFRPYFVKSNHV